eukprot:g4472.t1
MRSGGGSSSSSSSSSSSLKSGKRRSSVSSKRSDDALLLPYGDVLQFKSKDMWVSKFVVVAPFSEDPSRLLMAMYDEESSWKEGGIGKETLRTSDSIVCEITEYSSTRLSGKDEEVFQGRSRGFMIAVSKVFDSDDVETLMFNALDDDQRIYWKRMFEKCILRVRACRRVSEEAQKEYTGWIPQLTKRSVGAANALPLMRQYQILQKDGRWVEDEDIFVRDERAMKKTRKARYFHQVPMGLRRFYFHIPFGTRKVLAVQSFARVLGRALLHFVFVGLLITMLVTSVPSGNQRFEFIESVEVHLNKPLHYSSSDLETIGYRTVQNADDFYGWLEDVALDQTLAPDVTFATKNLLLGAIRVRQVRRAFDTCAQANATGLDYQCVSHDDLGYSVNLTCDATSAASAYSISDSSSLCKYPEGSSVYAFSSSSETRALPDYKHPNTFYGEEGRRELYEPLVPFSGYVVDIDSSNETIAKAQILAMKNSEFLSVPQTVMIYVSTATYNPNMDMLGQVEVRFEVSLSGKFDPAILLAAELPTCTSTMKLLAYMVYAIAGFDFLLIVTFMRRDFLAIYSYARRMFCFDRMRGEGLRGRKRKEIATTVLELIALIIVFTGTSLLLRECGIGDEIIDNGGAYDSSTFVDLSYFTNIKRVETILIIVGTYMMLVIIIVRGAQRHGRLCMLSSVCTRSFVEICGGFLVLVALILGLMLVIVPITTGGLQKDYMSFRNAASSMTHTLVVSIPESKSMESIIVDGHNYAVPTTILAAFLEFFRMLCHYLVVATFVFSVYEVEKKMQVIRSEQHRNWSYWEHAKSITIPRVRRFIEGLQMSIILPSFYRHVVDAIVTNESLNGKNYLTYDELYRIVADEVRHHKGCCGVPCRCNVFRIFLDEEETIQNIVQTLIATHPVNMHALPTVLRYWALRRLQARKDLKYGGGDDEGSGEEKGRGARARHSSRRFRERGDDDDGDDDDGASATKEGNADDEPLDTWSNATAMDLADATSLQQIRAEWDGRTLRGELLHASAYAFRSRSTRRLSSLGDCVQSVRRSQRIMENLVASIHERVSTMSAVVLDVSDEEEEEEEEEVAINEDEEKANLHDAVAISRSARTGISKISAAPGGKAAAASDTSSSRSISDEGAISNSKSIVEPKKSKKKNYLLKSGTKKFLDGLGGVSSTVTSESKREKKFIDSARNIQSFQDELNATIAELEAERMSKAGGARDLSSTDDRGEVDAADAIAAVETSGASKKWANFEFESDFLKKWAALNRNNPVDKSWDTLDNKFRSNRPVAGPDDGDANRSSGAAVGASNTGSDSTSSSNSTDRRRGGGILSMFKFGRRRAAKRVGDDGAIEKDENAESGEIGGVHSGDAANANELPDLWSVDHINAAWAFEDEEWRDYVAQNRPEALKGKRIEVRWEEGYQSGTITQYNPHTQRHRVEYDDGELRLYDLRRKKYRFLM